MSDNTHNNPETSSLTSLLATSREAVKIIGTSGYAQANAVGVLTASTALAYQNSQDFRNEVNKYLSHSKSKLATKETREALKLWLFKTYELSKPEKGARAKEVFTFNNKVGKIELAFRRAQQYAKRGLEFEQHGKRVYIPAENYSSVMNVATKDDVEVTTMNEKDTVTWSGLAASGPKKASGNGGKSGNAAISATPENIAILCKAVKTSVEASEPTKLAGSDKVAMLDAFFALQIALGAKEDKALVAAYEELTNAQKA